MSRKPRKPRATKQAATPQKSSGAVISDDATSSIITESANPPEIASETVEPAKAVQNTADESPMTMAVPHQSMIPPTDDIDDGWGSEDDDKQGSPASATVQLTETAKLVTGLPVRAESAGPTNEKTTNDAPTPSVVPSRPSAAPTKSASVTPPQKAPVVDEVTSLVDAAVRDAAKRSVAPARSSTPASGITSVRPSAVPSTTALASVPPSRKPLNQGMASVAPPPPSARGNATRETTGTASEAASRSLSRRPSPSQGIPTTPPPPSTKSIAPRDAPDAASGVVARPSRSPATMRPSAIALHATQAHPSKVSPSLRPNATASSVAEAQPRRAPSSLRPSAAPRTTAVADASADQKRPAPSATPVPAQAAGTQPEATVGKTTASVTESMQQADVGSAAIVPPSFEATALSLTQPSPEVRAVELVPAVPAAARVDIAAAAALLPDSDAISFGPDRNKRKRVMLAALWVATAVVPATIVWFAKPPPSAADCNCKNGSESRAAVAMPLPPVQKPVEPVLPVVPPPIPQKETVEEPPAPAPAAASEVASSTPTPAATSAAPATSAASTVPVVVETDSNDRISVLVKSRPTGAKVLRRGKEIGRTPLTIQIGRGEHRIFEVGSPAYGTRRISLDGEKTEVMVTIGAPPKPDK